MGGRAENTNGLLACCAFCGAAAFLCLAVVIVLGFLGLGIAKIVIGAMYLHECDIEKMVPIFLIVSAVAPILFSGFGKQSGDDEGIGPGSICGIIGLLFNIGWLIAGSVWVYGTWGTVRSDKYFPCPKVNATTGCTPGTCNNTLLTFSFVMVTIDWIFMGLWIIAIACILLRVCVKNTNRVMFSSTEIQKEESKPSSAVPSGSLVVRQLGTAKFLTQA